MKTYRVELGGTITRDIIWRECDAESIADVHRIAAIEMPTYRVRSVEEIKPEASERGGGE